MKYFNLKGGTLNDNGDRIKVRSVGRTDASTSAKLSFAINNNAMLSDFAIGSLHNWFLDSEIIRSGTNTIVYNYSLVASDDSLSTATLHKIKTSNFGNITLSSDNSIIISGQDSTGNKIFADTMSVEYYPI